MIVRDDPSGGDGAWLAIGQPAHAWVSGQAARAWGNAAFAAPAPWEEVCLAAEQHDIGMAAWDLAPMLNPRTGRAYAFAEMQRFTADAAHELRTLLTVLRAGLEVTLSRERSADEYRHALGDASGARFDAVCVRELAS